MILDPDTSFDRYISFDTNILLWSNDQVHFVSDYSKVGNDHFN